MGRRAERGFSLLEILVAFSILALSLGVFMQIFSASLRNADITRDQAQAMPRQVPTGAAIAVSRQVSARPLSSMGHCASTTKKSRLMVSGWLVDQKSKRVV